MTIIFYDGSVLHCDCVEISNTHPDKLIVDGYKVIPAIDVHRIVTGLLSGRKDGVASQYADEH